MPSENVALIVEARNARREAREVRGFASAIDETGHAATRAGRAQRAAGAVGRGFRSTLGGLATAAKVGAAGLIGLGVAGGKMGIDFNATMESNTVAFENFLGGTRAAEKHLDRLYGMAANTPFEFEELLSGSRRLLAFGQTARQSNKWLGTIGDTVAGIGGGSAEIDRLVGAIGQIQAKGKASTEEMLQIAELGIPAFDLLAKHTGRSMGQVFDDLSKGVISSDEALGALQKGMNRQFGGSSAKQAKTFTGQLSTAKDNMRQLAGVATKPLFEWARKTALPKVNEVIGAMIKGLKNGGLPGMARQLDKVTGAGGRVTDAYRRIKAGVQDAIATIRGFKLGKTANDAQAAIAKVDTAELGSTLDALVRPVRWLIGGLRKLFEIPGAKEAAATLVGVVVSVKALNRATGGAIGGTAQMGLATVQLTTAVLNFRTARISSTAAETAGMLASARARVVTLATTAATKAQAAATWILNAAMRANPIMLAVTALTALGAGLVLAYRKVGWFRNAVQAVWGWIKSHWGLLVSIIGGPIGTAVVLVIKHWDKIKDAATATWQWIRDAFGNVVGFFRNLPGRIGGALAGVGEKLMSPFRAAFKWIEDKIRWISDKFDGIVNTAKDVGGFAVPGGSTGLLSDNGILGIGGVPGLATGGTVTRGAGSWVTGEDGPEVNSFDGAGRIRVQPLTGKAASESGSIIDYDRLAEAVARALAAAPVTAVVSGPQAHRQLGRIDRRDRARRNPNS